MSHSKHPPVWFPAPSIYKWIYKRENYGSGEIQCLGMVIVNYFGTDPKAFNTGESRPAITPDVAVDGN